MNPLPKSRTRALAFLSDFGYEVSSELPLLESDICLRRNNEEAAKRLLALHAVVALAFDWPARHKLVSEWLTREELWEHLTTAERGFVERNDKNAAFFMWKLEALFGLAWASNLFEGALLSSIPDDFVFLFPSISKGEPTALFKKKLLSRKNDELIDGLDILYCLDSAITDRLLNNFPTEGSPLHPLSVKGRRHALEWLCSTSDWDDISLDT